MSDSRPAPDLAQFSDALDGHGASVELKAEAELPAARRAGAPVVLVLIGVLLLEHQVEQQRSAEVLAAGDLFSGPVPARVVALTDVRLCLLRSLRQVTDRQPQVGAALAAALLRQQGFQARLRTIAHMPRADDRVLALVQLLAERFGQRAGDGVHIPFRLLHQHVGLLIGARRPTVTTAISDLVERGLLTRTRSGCFDLPATLAPPDGRFAVAADDAPF